MLLAPDSSPPRPHEAAFAIRPRPQEGEAAWSFLMRAASANGFVSVGQLCGRLGAGEADVFGVLCKLLRVTTAEAGMLVGPVPRRWGSRVLPLGCIPEDFNQTLRRWCPMCLREALFIRADWTMKLSTACDCHGLLLRQRCGHCQSVQRWGTGALHQCACGTPLADAPVVPADQCVVSLSQLLLGRRPVAVLGNGVMSPAQCRRLVKYLGQFEFGTPERPGQIAGLDKLDVAIELVAGAARLLMEWPSGLQRVLARMHESAVRTPSVRKAFWPLYRVLYEDLVDECYGFLREAFEFYLRDNWWGVMCRRNRLMATATVKAHPRVSLKQVAVTSAVPMSTLKRLVQAELISCEQATLRSGRQQTSFHASELTRVSSLTAGGLNVAQAAHRLRLTKDRVRQLIRGDLLKPLVSVTEDRASAWIIPASEVERLVFAGVPALDTKGWIQFSRAMQHEQIRAHEFEWLVRAILQGDFELTCEEDGPTPLGELRLERAPLRAWLERRRRSSVSDLSIAIAGKELGLKEQVAFELAQRGLLECTIGVSGLAVFHSEAWTGLGKPLSLSPRLLNPEGRYRALH